ncbi:MAG: hypothetical protein AAB071_04640 [Bacteroidota bacterium]
MATKLSKSMETLMSNADTAFTNTKNNAAIKAIALTKGYADAAIDRGLDYVTEARAMVKAKQDWEGEVSDATKDEAAAKKAAVQAYQKLAKIARAKWSPHSPELIRLGLVGTMPTITNEFISAGFTLVQNIFENSDIKDYFVLRGYDDAKLTDALDAIKAYEAANNTQNELIGLAKEKTTNQTNILETLRAYYQEFKEVMQEVLTLSQQRSLNLIKRTTRTKAQKQAGKKAAATKKAKKNV